MTQILTKSGQLIRQTSRLLLLLSAILWWGNGVRAQVTGTVTVPGTYASIAAAVTDLNTVGVGAGGATVSIAAGYTETAPAGGYALGSAALNATLSNANQLIFQKSGAGANPLITSFVGTVTPTALAGLGDGVFRLMGTDYVTINGIDIVEAAANTTTLTQMEYGYGLFKLNAAAPFDGCQNNTIKNCTVTLNRTNTFSIGILIDNRIATSTTSITAVAASDANSNNKFYTNILQNMNSCIWVRGYNSGTTVTTLWDTNNDFGGSSSAQGNQLLSFAGTTTSYGIYAYNQVNANYSYNTINNYNGGLQGGIAATAGTIYGIYAYNSSLLTGVPMNATANNNTINWTLGTGTAATYGVYVYYHGGNTNINDNTISWGTTGTCTGTWYGIYDYYNTATAGTTTSNCNNNIIGNCSFSNSTGTIYGIYHYGISNNTVNFQNNKVQNITRNAVTTGTMYCLYPYYSTNYGAVGYTTNINDNLVDNIVYASTATSGTLAGMYFVGGNYNLNVYNNSVTNLTHPGTGTMYGMYNYYYGTQVNVHHNNVKNLTSGTTTTGGTIYGFYDYYYYGLNTNYYNNEIDNLTTGGSTSVIYGWYKYYNGGNFNAYKNRITRLNAVGTTVGAATVYGVYQFSYSGANGNTGNTWKNNYIGSFNTPYSNSATAQVGFYSTAGTACAPALYNNTIYLTGTNAQAAYGTCDVYMQSATQVNLLQNNILINLGTNTNAAPTGKISAIRNIGTAFTPYNAASNNNIMYAGTPSTTNVIYFDGTNSYQTMPTFQTAVAPREVQSQTENVVFVGTTPGVSTYLHVNTATATLAESGGVANAAVTDDYDGDIRFGNAGYTGTGTAPDVGADEFNGVTPAPAVASPTASPSGTQCTATARTITATVTSPTSITAVNLAYAYNGTAQTPIAMVNTSGNVWSATLPAATPTNAIVTWSVVATNSAGLSAAGIGTSYQDDPYLGIVATVTANPNPVCALQATTLNLNIPGPQSLPTGYAASNATSTADEEIHGVSLGTAGSLINQTSTNTTTGGVAANGLPASVLNMYSNYTGLVSPPTLVAGTSYPITLTLGYNGVTSYSNMAAVYIDLNRNGIFDLPSEQLFTKAYGVPTGSVGGSDGTATGTIAIPSNATPGRTLMRVVYVESSAISPTGTYSWGETEDYMLNIVGIPAGVNYTWYSNGTSIGTGSTYSYTTTTPGTETITAMGTNTTTGCTFGSNNLSLVISPIPTAPTASAPSTQCGLAVPTCSVTSTTGATTPTFKWYAAATGGTALQTSTSTTYTTAIATTTTFYVSEVGGTCESARTPVTANVTNGDAVAGSISVSPVCQNSSTVLNVAQAGGYNNNYNYTWTANTYVGSGLTGPTSAGAFGAALPVTITPTLPGTYTYTITGTDGFCTAFQVRTLTVNPQPVINSAIVTPTTVCGGGTVSLLTVMGASGPSSLPTGYAASNATSTADEEILGVSLGTSGSLINQTSSCTTTGGAAANGLPASTVSFYSNYTSTVAAPTLILGSTYPITLTLGYCNATSYSNMAAVYIDLNRNGVFDLPAEQLFTKAYGVPTGSVSGGPGTATGTITIPATATPGYTLMRVVYVESSVINPTGTYTWGETEDYQVFVAGPLSGQTYTWSDGSTQIGTGGNTTGTMSTTGGVYNVTFTATQTSTGCQATLSPAVPVTVIALPSAPTATNSSQCGLAVPTCSVTSTSGNATPTFKWYAAATGGTALQTSTSTTYTTAVNATTTFYVTEAAGSCESSPRTPVTVTVTYGDPLTATASVSSVCQNSPLTLSVAQTGTMNFTYNWSAGTGGGITGTIPGGTISAPLTPSVTPTASGTMTYTVTGTDGYCTSVATVNVTVNPVPAINSAIVSPTALCGGTSISLLAIMGAGGSGGGSATMPTGYAASNATSAAADEEIKGVQLGTGGSLLNNASTCAQTGSTTAVNGLPASILNAYSNYTYLPAPTLSLGTTIPVTLTLGYCLTTSYSNMAAIYIDLNRNGVFDLPAEQLYTKAYGVPAGSVSGSSGTETGTITIPSTATPGYTLMRVVYVESTVISPTGTYTWGETEDYQVLLGGPLPGQTYTWSDGTTQIATGGNTTGTVSTVGGTYPITFTATITATGCQATLSPAVPVTVYALPSAPTATNSTQCGLHVPTASVTSTSGLSNPVFKWYAAATGGTALQTGTSTTYLTAINTTTTFYVSEIAGGLCESSPRTPITVTVYYGDPITATVSSASVCSGGTVNLGVTQTGSTNSYTYAWTASPTTGSGMTTTVAGGTTSSPASVPVSPTTANNLASNTYTYTVVGDDGTCATTSSITVTANPNPLVSPTATPATICAGATSQLHSGSFVSGVLNTPLTTNNSSSATGFDITNTSTGPVTLHYFSFQSTLAAGTAGTVSLYYNPTAMNCVFPTNVTTAPGWILIANVPTTSSGTTPILTQVPFNVNITIPAGATYAFAIGGMGQAYFGTGTATCYVNATTPELTVKEGFGGTLTGTIGGRAWIGSVTYDYGTPGLTYAWTPSASLSNAGIINPVATPPSTTPYTVTVTNPVTSCVSTASTTVTVVPVPTAPTVTGNLNVCGATTTTLSAGTPATGNTFAWYTTSPAGSPITASTPYAPVSVTGFNNDVVANGVGTTNTATTGTMPGVTYPAIGIDGNTPTAYSFIDGTYQWYSGSTLPTCSLPATGAIASTLTTGLTYQLQSYTGNNALSITSNTYTGSVLPTTGTLTLATPASYGNLKVLYETVLNTASSNKINATVTFTDLSTQTFNNNTVVNWFTATGVAYTPSISRAGNTAPGAPGACGTGPYLFELNLPIDILNQSKLVQSVTFSYAVPAGTSSNTVNYFHALAVGGKAPNPSLTYTTPSLTGTTTYYVAQIGAACSSALTPVTVNWQASPVLTLSALTTTICSGSPSAAINVTSPTPTSVFDTYTWSAGANATGTATTGFTVSPTTSGNYVLTGAQTSGFMCADTQFVYVTVNPLPNISAVTATPATVCNGGNTSLLAVVSSVGPSSYCAPTHTSATTSGDYCSLVSIASTTLSNSTGGAAALPNYTLYPATGSTTATLVPGNTYTMTLACGTYTVNDIAAWIDFNQNGTFDSNEKLGETDNMGASPATTTFTFTVPAATINGTTRLRVRETDHATANDMDPCIAYTWGETEDYTITIASPLSYAWTPATGLSSATVANPTATVSTASTSQVYTVTVTNTTTTCSSTSSTSVAVTPRPTAVAAGGGTACAGATAPTVSVALTGTSPWALTYTNGGTPVSITGITTSPYTITNTSTGTYTVTALSDALCTSVAGDLTGSGSVTINPVPTGVMASASTTTLCLPGTVDLYGAGTASSGSATYDWDSSPSGYASSTQNPTGVAPTSNTTYILTVTDAVTSCTASANVTVNVGNTPASSTLNVNTPIHPGCNNQIDLQVGGGNTGYYAWYTNSTHSGISVGNGSTLTATPGAAGSYTYYVFETDATGLCFGSSVAAPFVTVGPYPTDLPNTPGVLTANGVCIDGQGWSHFYYDGPVVGDEVLLLSIDETAHYMGQMGLDYTVSSEVYPAYGSGAALHICSGNGPGCTGTAYPSSNDWYVMNRDWNVNIINPGVAQIPAGTVLPIRSYFTQTDFNDVQNTLLDSVGGSPIAISNMYFYKISGNPANNQAGVTPSQVVIYSNQASGTPSVNTSYLTALANNATPPTYSNSNGWGWVLANHTANTNGLAQFYAKLRVASFSSGGGGGSPVIPMPVDGLELKGVHNEGVNTLTWTTQLEQNNSHFELLRGQKKDIMNKIATIQSKAPNGTSSLPLDYEYVDTNPSAKTLYYVLRQVDIDGHTTMSNTVEVTMNDDYFIALDAYPNPTSKMLNVNLNAPVNSRLAIEIHDLLGKVVYQQTYTAVGGTEVLSLDVSKLATGSYTLQIRSKTTDFSAVSRFVKINE